MAYIPKPEKSNPAGSPHGSRKKSHDFYRSPLWRKTRKRFIQLNPFCKECKDNGKLVSAKIVDHIQRVNPSNPLDTQNGTWGEPLNFDNMQPLCRSCHDSKSARERWRK